MPIDYKKYPNNWGKIRKRILDRAGNRCELCGVINHKYVVRSATGFVLGMLSTKEEAEEFYVKHLKVFKKPVKIILTIHHINGDINDNRDCNLIALCQRCHLRLDRCRHIDNRRKNKKIKELKMKIRDSFNIENTLKSKKKLKDYCSICKYFHKENAYCIKGNFNWRLDNLENKVKCEDYKKR